MSGCVYHVSHCDIQFNSASCPIQAEKSSTSHKCSDALQLRWLTALQSINFWQQRTKGHLQVAKDKRVVWQVKQCDPINTCQHAILQWRFRCYAIYKVLLGICAFSALTLLVGRQEGHPACKKQSGGVLAWLSVWSEVRTCIWPS